MKIRPEGPLGEALFMWIDQQRVSMAHVARHGHVAVNTMRMILLGETRHPTPDTLRRLARGIATAPRTHEVAAAVAERCYQDLAIITGYTDVGGQETDTLLRFGLLMTLKSEERARAWAEQIAALSHLEPAEIATLRPHRRRDAR